MIDSESSPTDAGLHASVQWPSARSLPLLLAILIALVTCFHGLAAKSLWFDETFSVELARLDWASMWGVIADKEANMMLYYALLHFWLKLGTGEFVGRAASTVFAVATLVPLYAVGRHLLGQRQAAVAVILMAVNSFFVRYAQELRGYSLVLLVTTTASYLFLVALEEPSWKRWGAYVVVSALAVYAHFFGALVVAAHALGLVLSRRRPISWPNLAMVYGLIGLLISPLVWVSWGPGRLGWVTKPSLADVSQLFWALSGGGRALLWTYFAVCAVAVAGTVVGRPGYRRGSWSQVFLLTWLLVPLITTFLVSITFKPVFVNRYLIIMLPPLVLLAAAGIVALPRRWLRVTTFIVVLALSLRGLVRWYSASPRENWRDASAYVLGAARPGDGVVFEAPYVRIPFEYYRRLRQANSYAPTLAYLTVPRGAFDRLHPQTSAGVNDESVESQHSPSRFWVIQSRVTPTRSYDAARSWIPPNIRGRYRVVDERSFPGILVFLHAVHDSLTITTSQPTSGGEP